MIVFERSNGTTPLYLVAGSDLPAMGAEKALRTAYKVHGGNCFYCREPIKADKLSIDHVEPARVAGRVSLQNLVLACTPCNKRKAQKPIEAFNKDAGREWLVALLAQVQDRLNRI
jgi:5-methylcytosine-specific restriction endonuclease McrA